jgi:4-amino-4-deoxy-L-arabinose transferase-like glycosyltransferase
MLPRRVGVVAAMVVGLAVRLVYVLGPARDRALDGDAAYYHGLARVLADGHGFVEPLAFVVTGERVASATHPPLFPLVLALPTSLGVDTALGHRVVVALLGLAVVPLAALVARRLAGPAAGVAAAAVAAVHPAFWMNDVNVLSEALVAPLVAATLLVALVARERDDHRPALALGALCGLGALTRGELLLLVPLLAVPLLRRRPAHAAMAVGAALVVVAPWAAYNAARFDEPVLLSNNLGGTLASANCDGAWFGSRIGWWELGCHDDEVELAGDESTRDRRLRRAAVDYALDHPGRAPLVAAARVGRVWNVYAPLQTVRLDGVEGRGEWPPRVGLAAFAVVVALGAIGARHLRRAGAPLLWLAAPVLLVTVVAAVFYGSPRFRVPADVALTVAAGIGASAVVRRGTTTPLRTPRPATPSSRTAGRTGTNRR